MPNLASAVTAQLLADLRAADPQLIEDDARLRTIVSGQLAIACLMARKQDQDPVTSAPSRGGDLQRAFFADGEPAVALDKNTREAWKARFGHEPMWYRFDRRRGVLKIWNLAGYRRPSDIDDDTEPCPRVRQWLTEALRSRSLLPIDVAEFKSVATPRGAYRTTRQWGRFLTGSQMTVELCVDLPTTGGPYVTASVLRSVCSGLSAQPNWSGALLPYYADAPSGMIAEMPDGDKPCTGVGGLVLLTGGSVSVLMAVPRL